MFKGSAKTDMRVCTNITYVKVATKCGRLLEFRHRAILIRRRRSPPNSQKASVTRCLPASRYLENKKGTLPSFRDSQLATSTPQKIQHRGSEKTIRTCTTNPYSCKSTELDLRPPFQPNPHSERNESVRKDRKSEILGPLTQLLPRPPGNSNQQMSNHMEIGAN